MIKKEITTKENLMEVLDFLNRLKIKYWIDGGWGVDILTGKQNREHRDIDVDFDGEFTEALLAALQEKGYQIETDWRPSRIELYHPEFGYIDIHPLIISEDGSAKQAGLNDDWYEFEAEWFSSAVFNGRVIPCISAAAQKIFHTGYELREVDIIDMKNLERIMSMNETLKIMAERFSCRNFTDQIPEDKELLAIAEAGIQAPSGMNRQHWQVIVVKDKQIIEEMDAEGMKILAGLGDKTMHQRILDRGGKLFYNAPRMIVIAIKEAFPKGAELIDCGIIAQNIVLAATSLGIANIHCGFTGLAFAGSKGEEFKKRLKFPEGYECGIGILLGYTAKPAQPHIPNQEKITIIE